MYELIFVLFAFFGMGVGMFKCSQYNYPKWTVWAVIDGTLICMLIAVSIISLICGADELCRNM
jgi:hypothetical protein